MGEDDILFLFRILIIGLHTLVFISVINIIKADIEHVFIDKKTMGRLVGDWKRHTERGKRERDFKKLEKENYNVKNIDKKRATGNKHNKKIMFCLSGRPSIFYPEKVLHSAPAAL